MPLYSKATGSFEASPLPRKAGFPFRSNQRSTAVRQNLGGMIAVAVQNAHNPPRAQNVIYPLQKGF